MSDECKECKLPSTKFGAPVQAGIFLLSEREGVLVSNFNAPEEKVGQMLEQRFGDKFKVNAHRVSSYMHHPPIWLFYFEVTV